MIHLWLIGRALMHWRTAQYRGYRHTLYTSHIGDIAILLLYFNYFEDCKNKI